MEKAELKVSAVIVAWNTRDFLRRCLASLAAETRGLSVESLVVDNASGDGSAEMVERDFPLVRLIRSPVNLGFARANNVALRRVLEEKRSDYVLLLNSDVVVPEGAVRNLASYLDRHPEVGAAAPALILPGGGLQTGVGGFLPTARSGFSYFLFLGKLFPGASKPLFIDQAAFRRRKKPVPVEWLSGACLLLRRETIERVGLMNEGYFFYLDDIDWGKRMVEKGIMIHYVPGIEVIHNHGVTYRHILKEVNTRWLGMLFDYVRRERGPAEAFLFRLSAAAGFLLRLGYHGIRRLARGKARGKDKLGDASGFLLFSVGLGKKPDPPAAKEL